MTNGSPIPADPRSRGRLFFASFLIVVGTILFLGNLGLLPIQNIWSLWPLVLIGVGILRIIYSYDLAQRAIGLVLVLFGTVFWLVNLGILHMRDHNHSWPISLLLISFGLAMLIKVLEKSDPDRPVVTANTNSESALSDFALMGSVKRRLDGADFRGGKALSILGNLELDLRHSRVIYPGQTLYLDVSTILGSAKIRVPENWRIRIQGAGIMGNYEDKTIPPAVAEQSPLLVVTGFALLGSVEIED